MGGASPPAYAARCPTLRSSSGRGRFRDSECDLAGDVNNAAYLRPLDEELLSSATNEPDQIDIEVEFRAPAHPGNKLILCDGRRRWIVGDGKTHATIVIGA